MAEIDKNSVGIVQTRTVRLVYEQAPLKLACGKTLAPRAILNPAFTGEQPHPYTTSHYGRLGSCNLADQFRRPNTKRLRAPTRSGLAALKFLSCSLLCFLQCALPSKPPGKTCTKTARQNRTVSRDTTAASIQS